MNALATKMLPRHIVEREMEQKEGKEEKKSMEWWAVIARLAMATD